jgi:hypothetical protein
VAASIALPRATARWWLSPDAIEHLAIANAWVHGAGFVDPVQWSYHLDVGPPLPAGSVRPPLLPLLLAIPLALGADLSGVLLLHSLWACAVVGVTAFVASGFMGLGAAAAAGLLLAAAPGWTFLTGAPLTEATGLAALLAVVAAAPGVLRAAPRALLCAALVWVAWLARPNLAALLPAVAVATAWELGVREALRSRSWWALWLGFGLLVLVTQLAVAAVTGSALYSGYDPELLSVREAWLYGREPVGTWSFVSSHAGEIAEIAARRVERVAAGLYLGKAAEWQWAGWLAVLGVPWALLRSRDGVVAHRLNAFCALGFALLAVLNYAGFEPRYLLVPVVCGSLCGLAALDSALRRLRHALGERGLARPAAALSALPAAAALLWVTLGPGGPATLRSWRLWDAERRAFLARDYLDDPHTLLCRYMDPDALVVAANPWRVTAICGNAALREPRNLTVRGIGPHFLAEKQPAYVVAERGPASAWLARRRSLRAVASQGELELFEVIGPGVRSRPWRAPPPLVCAGRGAECLARLRGQPPAEP